jgi:CRP-like cAMP-binding protein
VLGGGSSHLISQELEVFHKGNKVATRVPQAFLGEIALLYNCERTASISNSAEVASVLTLRAEHFQRMLDRVPDMREQIEGTQRSRMVYSFMVLSGLFDKQIDTEEATASRCAEIAKRVSVRSIPAGSVLAAPHTRNQEFIMLYQGTLSRTRHDAKSPDGGNGCAADEQKLSPGGYAGGVAMLRLDGTTEHIVASTACLLLVAEGDDFFAMLESLPQLYAELLLKAFANQVRRGGRGGERARQAVKGGKGEKRMRG